MHSFRGHDMVVHRPNDVNSVRPEYSQVGRARRVRVDSARQNNSRGRRPGNVMFRGRDYSSSTPYS